MRFAVLLSVLGACSSSSEEPTPGEDPPQCLDQTGPTGALVFDGVDDHATATADLGLAKFTIEAWVRRDGIGKTATSGAGGLLLVPIASKGLGEGDGSNIDCNYMFGFAGDVIGADFEDAASGANHPVYGKTAIARGEWHHVAATYDGAKWRLYVDGKLDAELDANATPRADSVHAFALGAAMTSDGQARGAFAGALDEVRVWNLARSPEEIAEAMHQTIVESEGLVARFALDDPDPALALAGATLVDEHVVLDQGGAALVAAFSPADNATVGTDVMLEVAVELPSRRPVDVTYHVREVTSADDFTVVVMPDTQIYTIEGRNLEHYFHDQTRWIRTNREKYNIVGVIHNGDIINNEPQIYQWNVADRAMARLETPEPGLADGVPFAVAVGNHDNKLVGANTVPDTTRYNEFFGVARFAGRSYYGGHHGARNDDSWFTFNAGGLDFVVVNLMYSPDQDPAVLAWARSIFEMHPEAFGILNTHFMLAGNGGFGRQATAIHAGLKRTKNLQLMTGGHISAESRRFDTYQGHTIHSMLADFQGRTDGGQGFMRLWEFSPSTQTVTVRTYSPTLDRFETDADSEFTLDVDLHGVGGPFRDISVSGNFPVTVDGLEPGKSYEWYATVDSCGVQVRTRLARFTTVASARKLDEQPVTRQRTKRVGSGAVSTQVDDPSLAD